MARVPRVPDFASYGRLVKCAKASAGQRSGPSGPTSGHAYLTWACSAAAVLGLRQYPTGQTGLARLAQQPGKGTACTVLAHQLARAVSYIRQCDTVLDRDKFFASEERRAGKPDASLDYPGISLPPVLGQPGVYGVSAREAGRWRASLLPCV
jgi:hypothetical protein